MWRMGHQGINQTVRSGHLELLMMFGFTVITALILWNWLFSSGQFRKPHRHSLSYPANQPFLPMPHGDFDRG